MSKRGFPYSNTFHLNDSTIPLPLQTINLDFLKTIEKPSNQNMTKINHIHHPHVYTISIICNYICIVLHVHHILCTWDNRSRHPMLVRTWTNVTIGAFVTCFLVAGCAHQPFATSLQPVLWTGILALIGILYTNSCGIYFLEFENRSFVLGLCYVFCLVYDNPFFSFIGL